MIPQNHQKVLDALPKSPGRITQRELCKLFPTIGPHEKDPETFFETTQRQVRQIIRDLRVIYRRPILSDRGGYFLMSSEEEAASFLIRLEREVMARNKSSIQTYKALRGIISSKSPFFEKQLELFDEKELSSPQVQANQPDQPTEEEAKGAVPDGAGAVPEGSSVLSGARMQATIDSGSSQGGARA